MVNGGALKDRSTSDLVVIFLAGLVGLYILGSMIFVIVVTVTGHDENLGLLLNRLGSIVNSIVGAVIGFVGGRGMGSSEGYQRAQKEYRNGHTILSSEEQPPEGS